MILFHTKTDMLVDFADAIGGNVYTLGGTFIKLFAHSPFLSSFSHSLIHKASMWKQTR